MPKKKRKENIVLNSRQATLNFFSANSGRVERDDDTQKQLLTLKDQMARLIEVERWLQAATREEIRKSGYTMRELQGKINSSKGKVQDQVGALEELQLKQQNFANRVVIPANDGEYAGNGKCYIQFVNVGMGDCSLIATPSGKTIMVDLGTDAQSDVSMGGFLPGTSAQIIRNSIKSKFFLNGGSTIDILLLTHPDTDHYNKLKPILKGHVSEINMVYYGGTEDFTNYFPQSTFVNSLVTGDAIKCVVLKETAQQFLGKPITVTTVGGKTPGTTGEANTIGKEYVIPSTSEIVLYFEKVGNEVTFKLSILSANAEGVWVGNQYITNDCDIKRPGEMKLPGTPNNVRSLLVLVECYGRKIIITGDATAIAEQYVAKTFPGILAAADTLRFGHHGSPTSSARVFIEGFTNIKRAVASTGGPKTVLHNLPKKRIIEEYIARVPKTAVAHTIYAFGDESVNIQPITNITNNLFATGSNGTVAFVEAKTTSQVRVDNKIISEQHHDHNS